MRQLFWKDATSYSQGQRGKVPQTAWECEMDGVRIWVSCGHIDFDGRWIVTCRDVGLERREVAARGESSEHARDQAVLEVYHAAKRLSAKMMGIADSAFAVMPLAPASMPDED